jgi:antitoxin component YwqK of YwqJK toxin-antitoxin module
VEGKVKAYYENGMLKGEVIYKASFQEGASKEYYENGKLKEVAVFEKGEIVSTKKYDEKGNVIDG